MENGNRKVLKAMDSEQLREYGYRMVDFIADYYKTIESLPVLSQVQPGYLHKLLPDSAPDHPETLEQILDDVKAKILPGVTHWQSPSFFAYFPCNSSVAGILGEMLSAGLATVSFNWISSPAATELEMIVLDWLAKLLSLPDHFLSKGNGGGVIQGTASEAILVVLIAARHKVLTCFGKNALHKLVVYSSDQTHCFLHKTCQIVGIHPENLRVLETDSSTNYALRPKLLQEAVSKDREAGLIPFFLCATVGTTSSTAVDPLAALGKIAKSNEMWFHVDAAYAGSACICPEFRQYIDGVETADSFNMNAHKWFLTNFDCSLLWVKDQDSLTEALSTNPEYLKNKVSQENLVVEYKDWEIPLGRRFRHRHLETKTQKSPKKNSPPQSSPPPPRFTVSIIAEESYRPILGSKRDIIFSLIHIIRYPDSHPRSIKDALKALFAIALYPMNRSTMISLGAIPALFSLIVKDSRCGIVEDATAVMAQVAGCEESEEGMRRVSGASVLADLLDPCTGSSLRIKENAVGALLNLARCGGDQARSEVAVAVASGADEGVMEGIVYVAENGSVKGRKKAIDLLKLVVASNGSGDSRFDYLINENPNSRSS